MTVELLHLQWTGFIAANAKKGTKPPKPLKIPRPKAPGKKKRVASVADLVGIFGPKGGEHG